MSQPSSSSSYCRIFKDLFAVILLITLRYSRATFSISYVEFHRVLTSWGISCTWSEWATQASHQAGRTMVVEWMTAKESLRTYSHNRHECKNKEIIIYHIPSLMLCVQTLCFGLIPPFIVIQGTKHFLLLPLAFVISFEFNIGLVLVLVCSL